MSSSVMICSLANLVNTVVQLSSFKSTKSANRKSGTGLEGRHFGCSEGISFAKKFIIIPQSGLQLFSFSAKHCRLMPPLPENADTSLAFLFLKSSAFLGLSFRFLGIFHLHWADVDASSSFRLCAVMSTKAYRKADTWLQEPSCLKHTMWGLELKLQSTDY